MLNDLTTLADEAPDFALDRPGVGVELLDRADALVELDVDRLPDAPPLRVEEDEGQDDEQRR